MKQIFVGLLACVALAGCSQTSPVGASSSGTPASPSPPAASTPAAAVPASKAFPPEGFVGEDSWWVVVAVAYVDNDPKSVAAERSLEAVGYHRTADFPFTQTFISCQQGIVEGLKLNPARADDYRLTSVTFPDAATAQQFVDAYQPGVVGTVEVHTSCGG